MAGKAVYLGLLDSRECLGVGRGEVVLNPDIPATNSSLSPKTPIRIDGLLLERWGCHGKELRRIGLYPAPTVAVPDGARQCG